MNLGKIKLSQLRALVAVATAHSFSEAALALDLSQSTISHSIAALESELGVVLISRGRHGATLTPVGETICTKAQHILQTLEGIGQTALQSRGLKGGQVRVVAFRSMASNILPSLIATLHGAYPNIQVTITELNELRDLEQAITSGKADVAVAEMLSAENFETILINNDPCVGLLPPNYPLKTTHLTWDHLYNHPLIASIQGSCAHRLDLTLKQAIPPVDVTYRIRTDTTIVGMVTQGLGIGLMYELSAQPIPQNVRVVQLPFQIFRPLGVSWPKEALLSPAVYAFLDVVKDWVKSKSWQPHPVDATMG